MSNCTKVEVSCMMQPERVQALTAYGAVSALAHEELMTRACQGFLDAWRRELHARPKSLFHMRASPKKGVKLQVALPQRMVDAFVSLPFMSDYRLEDAFYTSLVHFLETQDKVRTVCVRLPEGVRRAYEMRDDILGLERALDWMTIESKRAMAPTPSNMVKPSKEAFEGVCLRAYLTRERHEELLARPDPDDTATRALLSFYEHHPFIPLEFWQEEGSSICTIKMEPHAYKTLRQLMTIKGCTNLRDFCTQAVLWWLGQMNQTLPIASSRPSQAGWRKVHVVVPGRVHEVVSRYARQDHHLLRTMYHHILMQYLRQELDSSGLDWLEEMWGNTYV